MWLPDISYIGYIWKYQTRISYKPHSNKTKFSIKANNSIKTTDLLAEKHKAADIFELDMTVITS